VFEKKIFAERVRQRRLALRIGVREMARRLGVAPSLITQYEDGSALPGLPLLVALARALDCSTDYLVGLSDDPHAPSRS